MKKFFAVCLCLLMCACIFAGCGGKKEKGLFKMDLSEYMTVEDYKGIKISSNDEDFLALVKEQVENDLANGGYGERIEVASGKVQMGDVVNISFVGTLNGVPFEGGTSNDYYLEIGSNSFIEGFEEGLIGKAIGSTVKLDLTFPETYQKSPDLAGKDVVFTVNIKTVSSRLVFPEVNDEIAKKLGFDNKDAYNAYAFSLAVKYYCLDKLAEGAKMIKDVPKKEIDFFVKHEMGFLENIAAGQGATLEQFLAARGESVENVEMQLREQLEKGGIAEYAVMYYIAQKENLVPDADAVEAGYEDVASMYSTTSSQLSVSEVKDVISYDQMEYSVVYDDVLQFLFENAEITE